jgi:DNA adenine methylase
MKPIISYYGGKQRVASRIVDVIRTIPHTVYVEPFAGGAAVLFAKGKPRPDNHHDYRECVNDRDERIVTLYRVCQEQKDELLHLLQYTPYSQVEHRKAHAILQAPYAHPSLRVAWAVVVQARQSFSNVIGGGWTTGTKSENNAQTWATYLQWLPTILERFSGVYVSCEDAIRCIQRWDSSDTLFYCDPPYPGANQGHYSGYTLGDWHALCAALDTCQGSYILSNYPQATEPASAQRRIEIQTVMSAENSKTRTTNQRTEVLWVCNRSKKQERTLFDLMEQEDATWCNRDKERT